MTAETGDGREVIEFLAIEETFATGVVAAKRMGPCTRLIFVAPADGDAAYVAAVAKIVIPTENARAIAMAILEGAPLSAEPKPALHLVN